MAEKLEILLARTAQLHEVVHEHVERLIPAEGARYLVAFQAALLSLEHATAALALVKGGYYASAYALMRPQYESLVRGVWLLYAARESRIARLSRPLTTETANSAAEGPMLAEMFKDLEGAPNAPQPIVEQLKQYRDATWKALNSFAHGGFHPLSRTLSGYPSELSYDVIRNSNAAMALTTQLATVLSGNPHNMEAVRQLHIEFRDCLPILERG